MKPQLLTQRQKTREVYLSGVIAGKEIRSSGKGKCPYPFENINGYYFENVEVNILSDVDVKEEWEINRLYGEGIDCYRLIKKNDRNMVVDFHCRSGQFVCDIEQWNSKRPTSFCYFNSSYYQKLGQSKASIGRMLMVEKLHQSLGYIGLNHLAGMIKAGIWQNCPIEAIDVANYSKYMHARSCMGCICGKRRTDPQVRTEQLIHHQVGDLVVMDLVFLTTHKQQKASQTPTGLLCIDHYSLFKCVVWIESKHERHVLKGVDKVIALYHANGHSIKSMKMDNERGGVHLLEHLGAKTPPITFDNCMPGHHVALVESGIGYLKSLWRSTILGVDFGAHCPRLFYKSAFNDCVATSNLMLTSNNSYVTPFQMFYNTKPQYDNYKDLKWGDVVTTKALEENGRDEDGKINFGVIIARVKPTGVSGFKVYNLETGYIITRGDCRRIASGKTVRKLISKVDVNKAKDLDIQPSLYVGALSQESEIRDEVDSLNANSFEQMMEDSINKHNQEYDDHDFIESVAGDSQQLDELAKKLELLESIGATQELRRGGESGSVAAIKQKAISIPGDFLMGSPELSAGDSTLTYDDTIAIMDPTRSPRLVEGSAFEPPAQECNYNLHAYIITILQLC